MKQIAAALVTSLLIAGCASLVPLPTVLSGTISTGTPVRLRGYVSLAFEGQSIYEKYEACEAEDTTRALWVDVERRDIPENWRDCSYAEISGVFRADDTGHFGGW